MQNLKVSANGFYGWLERSLSQRQQVNKTLTAQIREAFVASDETTACSTSVLSCRTQALGWVFGRRMTADLVILALNMALSTRKTESVFHHSDQDSLYTSIAFGSRCKEMVVPRRWELWGMRTTTP